MSKCQKTAPPVPWGGRSSSRPGHKLSDSVVLQPVRHYRDRHSVGQRVEYRGVSRPQLAYLLQLLVWHVGFDLELDPDSLISVAHVLVEFQKSVQINIAFQERL